MARDPETQQAPARVLVVMAHPDDPEFICAGTIARWASAGSEIIYVLGTSGDKGSDDPAMSPAQLVQLREEEQREAARRLGVQAVEFLGFRDAELVPDLHLRRAITRMIRRYRPDAVICQDPTARWAGQRYLQHPDHIAMGEATLAAVYPAARDRLTFPELLEEGLEPHKVREVYLAAPQEPDLWVDITAWFDAKLAALSAHESQMGDWDVGPFLRQWGQDTAAQARMRRFPGAEQMVLAEAFKYFTLD
ncbi:MAG: PIG-L family deacetylase [Sphaerobacter sp.]|nr:PIG-L family deacetylase [Sphaerobacter sp.]